MPAKDKINLLPKDDFENTQLGRFVNWAINVGRWIIVFTELIVICAFLSRFYFDTKISNLFDETRVKKAMITTNLPWEENFRQFQEKTKIIKSILAQERTPSVLFAEIAKVMPLDLTLKDISVTENSIVSMTGYCLSERGLKAFLTGLKNLPSLTKINLSNISQKDQLMGTKFSISAEWKK